MSVTYPFWWDPETFYRYTFPFFIGKSILIRFTTRQRFDGIFLAIFAGGVKLNEEDSTLEEFNILALNYFLYSASDKDIKLGSKWEDAFLELIAAQDLPDIEIVRFSSLSMERELENNTNSVIPYFSFNLALMIVFCIFTCMMTDWVKSKPLLGLLGVVSAVLATIGMQNTFNSKFIKPLASILKICLFSFHGVDHVLRNSLHWHQHGSSVLDAWHWNRRYLCHVGSLEKNQHSRTCRRTNGRYVQRRGCIRDHYISDGLLEFFRWSHHSLSLCENILYLHR